MTKPKLPPAKDWRARSLADWNTTTWHAYLIDRTRQDFNVEYVPFGRGPIGKRWRAEQGQLKQAVQKYGNEVLKAWIDEELAVYKPSEKYPFIAFGFMYAYRREGLAKTQAKLQAKERAERTKQAALAKLTDEEVETLRNWF